MRTQVVVGAVMGAVLAVYAGVLLGDRGDAAEASAIAPTCCAAWG